MRPKFLVSGFCERPAHHSKTGTRCLDSERIEAGGPPQEVVGGVAVGVGVRQHRIAMLLGLHG